MVSIRDKDFEKLKAAYERSVDNPAVYSALFTLEGVIKDVLDGAKDLMREQQPSAPRLATFNDLPPKGWTGPDE